MHGPRGRDAKQARAGSCNGTESPKGESVCCGESHVAWHSYYSSGSFLTVDTGPQMFVGSNAGYVQNYKFNTVYLRQSYSSRNYWGHYDAHNFNSGSANQLNPKWCLFGETFPTGNMRVNLGETQEDEYPCKGIRLINEGSVVTNQAQICCGATDTRWKSKGSMRIYKDIDTSSCKFANDASNKMVYITSLGGNGGHWRVSGTTAYVTSSPKGFSMSLGVHNSQKSATYASQHGWYVNWCGIGKIVT